MPDAQINALIEKSFQSALEGKTDFFSAGFFSDAVLIGIGAPVHLFLEPVARMLHTRAVIPEHASVANAVGAVVGNVSASVTAQIRPDPVSAENFRVITQKTSAVFSDYDESMAYAREKIEKAAEELLIQKEANRRFPLLSHRLSRKLPLTEACSFLQNISQ